MSLIAARDISRHAQRFDRGANQRHAFDARLYSFQLRVDGREFGPQDIPRGFFG
jgi:hypothetical protein